MSLEIRLSIPVDAGGPKPVRTTLYRDGITANVWPMFLLAGCADALNGGYYQSAGHALPSLAAALAAMAADPTAYKALAPANGWGDYDSARTFLRNLVEACGEFPKADLDSY